jgi:single-strand DNA-binding protein
VFSTEKYRDNHLFYPQIWRTLPIIKIYIVMIKMQVIGHLGKDCTTNLANGRSVMNFTIAHTEKYKDAQGAMKEKTTWVDCAYWTDRTGIAPYLKKGTQVFVEGTPDLRMFTRNDGTNGGTLTLTVRQVQLLGGGRSENSGGGYMPSQSGSYADQSAGASSVATTENPEPIDDLPF